MKLNLKIDVRLLDTNIIVINIEVGTDKWYNKKKFYSIIKTYREKTNETNNTNAMF